MKLFVGNISWDLDENSLRSEFERFGSVEECNVIYDRETGRSRGFGFVTFEDQDGGQKAIQELDGRELAGRALKVNEAHARPEKRQRTNRW